MPFVYGLRRPVTLGQTTSRLSRDLVECVLETSVLPSLNEIRRCTRPSPTQLLTPDGVDFVLLIRR